MLKKTTLKSKIKNIVHLIATNFYGGPEKQIVEHLIRLNDGRYRKVLVSFIENGTPNEILGLAQASGIKTYGIPMSGPFDFKVLRKLRCILQREQADLLCTHGYKSTVLGWWVSRHIGIPVIAFSRGYTAEDPKVTFYEWLERRVLGKLSGVVCVSEGQRKRLASLGVRCQRTWVVHNAVTTPLLIGGDAKNLRKIVCKRLGVPADSILVVTAGRLSPEKGHSDLIDAICNMEGYAMNTCFVFCGEGASREKLERQARKLKISDQCRFVGFRYDLQEIFHSMDLMVLPSLTEGLPNVVLEAFACAKAVVATAVGGVPEIIQDGKNGLLVPAGRPDLLALAMKKCLVSPDMRKTMGETGYQTVKSKFTFEEQTQKLEEVYYEVLNRKGVWLPL